MPTFKPHNDDAEIICLDSDGDEDDEAEIDVGGPEQDLVLQHQDAIKPKSDEQQEEGVKPKVETTKVEDMNWLTRELAMLARAEVEKQRKENLRQARAAKAARQARGDSSDDDIEIISSNVNPKPTVVPVSISVPKALKNLLKQSLIARNGSYEAKQDLTKALESALGCNIRNFNCILSDKADQLDSKPPNNNFESNSTLIDRQSHEPDTKRLSLVDPPQKLIASVQNQTTSKIAESSGQSSKSKVSLMSSAKSPSLTNGTTASASQTVAQELKESLTSPPTKIESKSCTLQKTLVTDKSSTDTRSLPKSSPNQTSTSLLSPDLNSCKESGIASRAFYGTTQTHNKPSNGMKTVQTLENEPLFKNGRATQGRIICKKQAFYSVQPTTATPAPDKQSPARETNSQTSLPAAAKPDTEPFKKTNIESNKIAKTKNIFAESACQISEPQNVRPKRQASFPKNPYVEYLDDDSDTRESLIEAEILKFQKLSKVKKGKKSVEKEPEDQSFRKTLLDPPTAQKEPKQNCLSEVPILQKESKPQVAKKVASKSSSPNEVVAFNLALQESEKNLEKGRKFLQKLDITCSTKKPMLSLSSLEEIFSNFKASLDCSSIMKSSGKNMFDHFLFENWSVSHLSFEIIRQIFSLSGKIPQILHTSALQLSNNPCVRLSTLNDVPTIQSDRKTIWPKSPKSLTVCQRIKSEAVITKPRLRPKYRHLMQLSKRNSSNLSSKITTSSVLPNALIPNEEKSDSKLAGNDTCRTKITFNRSTSPDHLLPTQNEETEMDDSQVWTPVKMGGSRPVRKFPQNFDVSLLVKSCKRSLDDEVSSDINKKTAKETAVKKGRFANFEMPGFTLGGLSQTLPDHIEGWFVNKLNKLKQISEELTASENKLKQKDFHCFSNGGAKNRSKVQLVYKQIVKQVCVSVGNVPLEEIIDLSDFRKNIETSNLFSELAFEHSNGYCASQEQKLQTMTIEKVPLRQDFSELLRVARKIEKISSQGFGKPAPKFTSAFLPPGYFRRINELTLHEEFVRVEDGLALPSVQAAIVRYLGHNHPQRYRARKSLKPKKFNFEFSNVKKRL